MGKDSCIFSIFRDPRVDDLRPTQTVRAHSSSAATSPKTRENRTMTGTRIDKWLWAARFFKTREQAGKACDMSRITSNNQPAKPAREVRVGDMLRIKNEGGEFEVEVLALSQQRGSAAI